MFLAMSNTVTRSTGPSRQNSGVVAAGLFRTSGY